MEPPISPSPGASPFSYGPQDRGRSRAEKTPPSQPTSDPIRPLPSETGSYGGHLARDIRATVDASRTGRLPGKGAKTLKRSTRGLITVLALAMIVATIATSASLADKCAHGNNPHCPSPTGGGGGGTSGSLSLVMVNDANGDGVPNYGDSVTFNLSTTATDQPWVNLQCFQNGVLVLQGWNGFFPASITGTTFGLYSGAWSGGAADCTAYLDMYSNGWKVLASTSFHVNA